MYRNLAVLEQAGLVVKIITNDDHAHYELAEHILDHHHHIICSPCGEILDFHLSEKIEKALESSLKKLLMILVLALIGIDLTCWVHAENVRNNLSLQGL